MNDCIFCKIISGEIPSFKIFENDTHIAILDINPNTKGVTLVISKEHYPSNVLLVDNDIYNKTLLAAKEVAKKLADKLNLERVGIAIEGTGVDHLHIKLYPFHKGENQKLEETPERIYNEVYPGYLTTQIGPEADFKELEGLAKELL